MVATSTSAALSALKNTPAPKFIRVKESDSEVLAQVAVPEVKRWKGRIAKILDGLPWAWIEPLDKAGNIVGPRVDNSELNKGKATELEDLELEIGNKNSDSELAKLHGLLALILKAQDVALVRQSEAYSVVLDNNQALLKTISDRLSSMERHAHQNFEVITALHNRLNLETMKGDDDDDGLGGLVKEVLGDVVKSKLAPAESGGTE